MNRWKIALSVVLGAAALEGADRLLRRTPGSAAGFLLCLLISLLVILITTRHRRFFPRTTRAEYILGGDGKTTERVFRLADHPGFTEAYRDREGAGYSDSSGTMILTRFGKPVSADGSLPGAWFLLGCCLVTAALGWMLWQLSIPVRESGALRWLTHPVEENLKALWDGLTRAVSHIRDLRLFRLILARGRYAAEYIGDWLRRL